ncbi:MAG: hypothetical protein ACREYF_26860 [Gammaproteobacteria bacterium]
MPRDLTPAPQGQRIAALAKDARRTLEALLEALGWPAGELAFHRAVDRLLQLEEGDRVQGREGKR